MYKHHRNLFARNSLLTIAILLGIGVTLGVSPFFSQPAHAAVANQRIAYDTGNPDDQPEISGDQLISDTSDNQITGYNPDEILADSAINTTDIAKATTDPNCAVYKATVTGGYKAGNVHEWEIYISTHVCRKGGNLVDGDTDGVPGVQAYPKTTGWNIHNWSFINNSLETSKQLENGILTIKAAGVFSSWSESVVGEISLHVYSDGTCNAESNINGSEHCTRTPDIIYSGNG